VRSLASERACVYACVCMRMRASRTTCVTRVYVCARVCGAGPSWPLDSELAALLGVTLSTLESRRPHLESTSPPGTAPPEEWATALVIALLQARAVTCVALS
jgi:hypothetical protein